MAIRPATRYPGQTSSPTAAYPGGSAKDVNVSGDGTGTPWQKDLVNDLFGFLQSLLYDAGITPSDVPDEVGASQYLEGLLTLVTRRSVWNDVAAVANFFHQFTDATTSGRAVLWNPFTKHFFSVNKDGSNNPTGWRTRAPYAELAGLTIDAGNGLTVHPYAALVRPSDGMMVFGGAPASSSQSRYRVGTGLTLAAVDSAKSASTVGPTAGVYAAGSINKFFVGYSSGGSQLESASDPTVTGGGTGWTDVPAGAGVHASIEFSPTLDMLITVNGTTTSYKTSTDGINFTTRTSPVAFHKVFWSTFYEKFIAADTTNPPLFYSSEDGINWTALAATDGPQSATTGRTFFFEYGRVIAVVGDGTISYSTDGCETFIEEVSTASPTGGSTFALSGAIDSERGTIMLGNYLDGFHMATGRFTPDS